jgi:hypothetical protein
MLKAAEGVTDSNQMGSIVVREGTQRSTWTDEVVLFHCCLLSGSPINEDSFDVALRLCRATPLSQPSDLVRWQQNAFCSA